MVILFSAATVRNSFRKSAWTLLLLHMLNNCTRGWCVTAAFVKHTIIMTALDFTFHLAVKTVEGCLYLMLRCQYFMYQSACEIGTLGAYFGSVQFHLTVPLHCIKRPQHDKNQLASHLL